MSNISQVSTDCSIKHKKTTDYDVVEPCQESCASERHNFLNKIMTGFQGHLNERANHFLGYPTNQDCEHFMNLSPFLRFNINNVGDPFKDSNYGLHSKMFEVGVLDWFAQLWEMEKDECWGYVTNGGTEGNLQGLLLGRELLPDGILYTSEESHYSIFKAARLYRMECKRISTLTNGEIDCSELREKLTQNKDKPAIVNVNIGTTFKGAIDNLDLIIKNLEECGFLQDRFYIHCDAATYGLIAPFLAQEPKLISFKKPIASVSVSTHKLLGLPMPSGVVMTRKRYISNFSKNIEYIASLDTTITGSRNGLAPIFIWYILNMKGRARLQQDVEKCLINAQFLRDRLKNLGISVMLNETSIMVIFERPLDEAFIKHWSLSCKGNMAHVVVMPHVTVEMLDDFVDDFARKRSIWYRHGEVRPPCLADGIGISNCCCLVHGKVLSIA